MRLADVTHASGKAGRPLSRRTFLKVSAASAVALAGIAGTARGAGLTYLQTVTAVGNPLGSYPARDWERIYRDQYAYDRSFTFICAPNDTHLCRLRAFVRNDVVVRIEQNYDGGEYGDPQGNKSSVSWNPRGCLKGYTLHRRTYGPYRLKGPTLRVGWKAWADDGFPSLSDEPALRTRYKFDARGDDDFVQIGWDEMDAYIARALEAIGRTYSGDEGRARLIDKDGYPEMMLEHWKGSGMRTMKFGSSLPVHGIAGKFGLNRFANMLGLLDANIRGVGPDEAVGARELSEYTWRGDQAPGFPFVHGLQGAEVDFNDLRNSRLVIQVGKNLVENKMPDSHWLQEITERGGKIVAIVPEYGPQSTKADYWIPVRAGLSDTALFLGIAHALISSGRYDEAFLKRFTDMPLLVRLDTLTRLRADELFSDYQPGLAADGPSFKVHGLTPEQYAQLGDRVVIDRTTRQPRALTREDLGDRMTEQGIDPDLEYRGRLTLADGQSVEVATSLRLYREHLADYDLDTVIAITGSPRDLVERLIEDIATIKPVSFHVGEGINHYFHATLHNRAVYLVAMLTGNVGQPGAGVSAWAGNYKGGVFQAASWFGPGVGGYVNEDPFDQKLEETDRYDLSSSRHMASAEETSYWGNGERPMIVDTPAEGSKVFTGRTHMPTPTKILWYTNANLINQAKWAYHLVKNVNPMIDMIVDEQIEWTGSGEFADVILPANSWLELEDHEMCASASNPFLQIWKGGIEPLFDSRDDARILAGIAAALSDLTGDARFRDHFKFVLEGKTEIYLDRVLAGSFTTEGYTTADITSGVYGEPGGALMQYRTFPRIPFWEQVHDSLPFYTDTGRMNSYVDIPEAIDYGENLISHREAVEATPYLPNVIVSTSPYVRPKDYGIPLDSIDAGHRQVRNVKMAWSDVRKTVNPLFEQGFMFHCLTPKSRHSVHSSWAVTDWNWIWNSNFGDPYRADTRMPGVGDVQFHMHPSDARSMGLDNGDYVWVDANPADRPYPGFREDDAFATVARLMARVTFNPAYPPGVTMVKHAYNMATPRTVRAAESRADGRAISPTGYQSSFRHGSQQSITRSWTPPIHQTDTLFHKRAGGMGFVFGFDIDNHAINTCPKEVLVKVTKAESGGIDGNGPWKDAASGMSPTAENALMQVYLDGGLLNVKGIRE
jgi:nitrate reductase alpha subunit